MTSVDKQTQRQDNLPPCGDPAHERGHWVDDARGIYWCPDCGTEIWVGEEDTHLTGTSSGVALDRLAQRERTKAPTVYTPAKIVGMPNKPKTPLRSLRVPDEVWLAAQAKALEEETTVSEVVREALVKYAAKKTRAKKIE